MDRQRLLSLVSEVQRLEGWCGQRDRLSEDEQVRLDVSLSQRRQELVDVVRGLSDQELHEELDDVVEIEPLLQLRE